MRSSDHGSRWVTMPEAKLQSMDGVAILSAHIGFHTESLLGSLATLPMSDPCPLGLPEVLTEASTPCFGALDLEFVIGVLSQAKVRLASEFLFGPKFSWGSNSPKQCLFTYFRPPRLVSRVGLWGCSYRKPPFQATFLDTCVRGSSSQVHML